MAHGAEMVSYFRWRQFPKAQEQMHAGLLRPDSVEDVGGGEARQAAADIAAIGDAGPPPKSVALLFDYAGDWVTQIQPQGRGFSALRMAFEYYSALRQCGFDVDILSPQADFAGYRMLIIPCCPIIGADVVERLRAFDGPVLIGPRSGSKTTNLSIPAELAPGGLQQLIPLKVTRVESLRDGIEEQGEGFAVSRWLEHVESDLEPEIRLGNGRGIVWREGCVRYLAGHPDAALLRDVIGLMAGDADMVVEDLPSGVRTRRAGMLRFAFNYGTQAQQLSVPEGAELLLGSARIETAGVTVWRE